MFSAHPRLPSLWASEFGSAFVSLLAALFAFFFTGVAYSQERQFAFDARGNLLSQTAENIASPEILSQPQPQVVGPGALASFFVVPANTRDLTYQWWFNGTNINGANNDALLLLNVGVTNEGQYSVVLVNSSGSVTSAPAALMLDGDRDGLADSWEQTHFGGLSQNPTGDFDGDGVSNLTEFLHGTDPANRASAVYRLTLMSDAGQVTVSPNRFWFTNGEAVTLTATAFAPDAFHAWAGDVDATNNPITLTITNNLTVFAYLSSYDITWTSSRSGDWFDASNWSPRIVPLAHDNVFLTDRSIAVTINRNTACRSLTFGSPSANVTLSGTGDLTLLADSFWVQGTMSGSGRTIIPSGVTLHLDNLTTAMLTGRTLDNAGTIVWTGAAFGLNSGILTNRPGALFEVQSAATIAFPGGLSRFDNVGTFRKLSPGTTTIGGSVLFNNYGEVDIQNSVLALQGGGVNEATILARDGTTLDLAGGAFTASPLSEITGAGAFTVSGGTATLAGLVNLGGLHLFSAGTANVNGIYLCTNNPATISGGTVNFNSASAVPIVDFNSGTLGGSGVLTVLNQMNWLSGTMSGAGRTVIAPGATLNLANGGAVTLSTRTLENRGTVLWTGAGSFTAGNSAVVTNGGGGLFEVQNNASFSFQGGSASRFDNAGTLRRTTASGTTTFVSGFNLNNYGSVEVQTGTLLCSGPFNNAGTVTLSAGTTNRLAFGGSASGSFTTPATALVDWTGGVFALSAGAQLNGSGLYRVSGATLTCNTDVSIQNLDLAGASTFNGSGTVMVSQVMNWTGGTMSGTGRTIIAPGAMLHLANGGAVTLSTRTLENRGTVLWTGAGSFNAGNSAVVTNGGAALFEVQNNASFSFQGGSASRFDNAGTLRRTTASGTTTFVSGFNLDNYGSVEVQTGTLLCSGPFNNAGTVTLSAGTTHRLAQSGSASGAFMAPATALVEWTGGTFTLHPGAQLNGSGLYRVSAATLTCNTDVSIQNLDLVGASTFNGSGTVMVSQVMNWTSGTMSGAGRTVIASGATLNVNNPSTIVLTTRTLENGGTILWTGANIALGSAVITNRAGALFQAQNAASLSFQSGASRFDNAGTFRKSGSLGTTTFASGVSFTNYGTVDIRSGIVAANGGYNSTSNALLNCALGGTVPGTNYGQLQVAGAVTLNGGLSVDLLPGFTPATNDTFAVLTAGTRNGTFANFSYPSNRVTLSLSNSPTSVILMATDVFPVPQPVLLTPQLAGSNALLTWTATSNVTYRLEFNPALTNPTSWTAIAGDVTTPSNTASKLDALTSSNRFYRVRVLP